ncbi:MAG: DMT family transporter [Hyphomicrobiaceae bacterium]|nr:DMT family transporter [Hyphomicrobiaceae bacterium]MCC0025106.1 DMT family transporter [Hyphomicrobiaceae bacterium]
MGEPGSKAVEYALLGILALLWGSSYLFIKVAVAEIPPVTLIAMRVDGAALFLLVVLLVRGRSLPTDPGTWGMLGIQSFINSIGAWTILAWGQQFVGAGLASVLNSTSPIFVFLFTALITRHEALNGRKLLGAILGLAGVVLIVGLDSLSGLGQSVAGQLACLIGAMLYAGSAIYGRRFASLGALETALGTMLWAAAVLTPLAFVVESPLTLRPGMAALGATLALSVLCTGTALLIYFRLVHTLGSLGVASQSYLRAGVGVILGVVLLGEVPTLPVLIGLFAAIFGVALINFPTRRQA